MCSLSMCSGGQGGGDRISRPIDENPAISSRFQQALSGCARRGTTVALGRGIVAVVRDSVAAF
jgi:hypothetical protein